MEHWNTFRKLPCPFCPEWTLNPSVLSNLIVTHYSASALKTSWNLWKILKAKLYGPVITKPPPCEWKETHGVWQMVGFGTQVINKDIRRAHETFSTQSPAYWWVKLERPCSRIILIWSQSVFHWFFLHSSKFWLTLEAAMTTSKCLELITHKDFLLSRNFKKYFFQYHY